MTSRSRQPQTHTPLIGGPCSAGVSKRVISPPAASYSTGSQHFGRRIASILLLELFCYWFRLRLLLRCYGNGPEGEKHRKPWGSRKKSSPWLFSFWPIAIAAQQ